MTPDERLKARRLLYDDYRVYAKTCLLIRPKEGDVVSLVFNEAQTILHEAVEKQRRETGRVRCIVLKGRQQGISTYIDGRGYWRSSQARGLKALVLAHKSESSQALFDMTKRYHDNAPALVKPSTRYNSKRELTFDILDSAYVVMTAGGRGLARGETLQFVHASEAAFWPAESAQENWNGLEQAVPNADGTEIFVESTANGVSGVFYNLWKGAVEGTNGFIPVFIPWFVQREYREPAPADFTRTPDEEDLVKAYGLDDAQLMWRRRKIAQNGIDLFRQEYPCHADEAFLTTGRPVFNPEIVLRLQRDARPPSKRLALTGTSWDDNARGELEVWSLPEPGEDYTIGADTSAGVGRMGGDGKAYGGDPSCAIVQDSSKRMVARWRGFVDPDYFATVLYHLGLFYNVAFICPENNNHGILTCARLGRDLAYPRMYQTTQYDKVTEKETVRLGFTTSVATKPLIIDQLRADLREGNGDIPDAITLSEMSTYIMTETGAMEAEKGCHDDCVMALALANHANPGKYTPVQNEDSFFVQMV